MLLSCASAGCVHRRDKQLVYVEEGALAPRDAAAHRPRALDRRRPRTPPPDADPAAAAALRTVAAARDDGVAAAEGPDAKGVRAPGDAPGPAPSTRPPDGHAPGVADASDPTPGPPPPPAHRALAEGVRLEDVAREVLFACETTVVAEKATLYVPPRYAAEATLSGATVVDAGPGRRTATLGVLRLRRLEVRARTLSLVVRTDGDDVSLTARGDVSFRAERPASVIDERGLKTLLVRNDGYTPLR